MIEFIMGLFTGLAHSTEADHVAAVSTQADKGKIINSSLKGTIWGIGHTTSIMVVAALVWIIGLQIEEKVFSFFEFGVGIMIIVFAFLSFFGHKHRHGSTTHIHPHSIYHHTQRSFIIGLIHGLAGSGSLIVLVASTMQNMSDMFIFISIFGVGSILGMTAISSIIGLPLLLKKDVIHKTLRYGIFLFAIFIAAEILITNNPFSL